MNPSYPVFLLLACSTAGAAGLHCEREAVVADGTLTIDSSREPAEFGWLRYAYGADNGMFAPNEHYRVSFKCRVDGFGKDARMLVVVRPMSYPTSEKDVLSLSIGPTDGKWREYSIPVETGSEPDYRIQFHSWNRIRAEIRDLKVDRRPDPTFVPATADAKPFAGEFGPLPQGAKEFDVDPPRQGTGLVLDAADYGASETNADNTAAFRAAIADARAKKADALVVRPGRYAFESDEPLSLNGFRDFTFDGQGSTFVSHRKGGAFLAIRDGERIKVRGFTLDWDWPRNPLASLVRVARTDEGSYDLEFTDYADFPAKESDLTVLSAYDPATRSVGLEDGLTRYIDMSVAPKDRVKREWIAGNTVRVQARPDGIAEGQLYRLQHYYYHMNGFWLQGVRHLALEDIRVLSTPGHAFVLDGPSHHVSFRRVDIVAPKDDPKRVITCTADHFHIIRSRGFIKLEDCEFSLGADDILNMHDCSGFVVPQGPKTVRTRTVWSDRHAATGDRIEFRNDDYSPTGFFGTLESVRPVDGRTYDLTFREDIPDCAGEGFVLFNWAYDTHNVIVRNCRFHDNRARALLILARDVTVENNEFRHHEMGALKIETGYTLELWSEGYGVSNVVVRGNVFDTSNPSGSYAGHRERTIYAGIYLRTDPSSDATDYPIVRDILIENNRFRDNCGVTAYLSSVSNVVVRGNTIEDPTPRRKALPYRSQFYLTHAHGVKIVDNVYLSSPSVPAPGVAYDSETCSSIVAEGNRIDKP